MTRDTRDGQRTFKGRVACDDCGVVQETTFSRSENIPDVAGVRSPKTADGECAVCGSALTGKKRGVL